MRFVILWCVSLCFLGLSACVSNQNSPDQNTSLTVSEPSYHFNRRPALSDAQKELQGGAENYHLVTRGSNILGTSVFFGAACLALGCDAGETLVSMDLGASISATTNGRTVSGLDERFTRATYRPNATDLNYLEEMALRVSRNLERAIRSRDEIIAGDLKLIRAVNHADQSGSVDRDLLASHARSAFDDLRAMDHLSELTQQRLAWFSEVREIFAADGRNTRRLQRSIADLQESQNALASARVQLSGYLAQLPDAIPNRMPASRIRLIQIRER